MDLREAASHLTTTIELKNRIASHVRLNGVDWNDAEQVAESIIAMMFETDIPRPELIEAYNRIGE